MTATDGDNGMKVTPREMATILAALREWHDVLQECPDDEWILESRWFERFSPLSTDEVYGLRERLEEKHGHKRRKKKARKKGNREPSNSFVPWELRYEIPTYVGSKPNRDVEKSTPEFTPRFLF